MFSNVFGEIWRVLCIMKPNVTIIAECYQNCHRLGKSGKDREIKIGHGKSESRKKI